METMTQGHLFRSTRRWRAVPGMGEIRFEDRSEDYAGRGTAEASSAGDSSSAADNQGGEGGTGEEERGGFGHCGRHQETLNLPTR